MHKLIVCAAALCAAACLAESAKSAYVGLLKPGQAFAPAVEEASGAGHVPVVDTDEVFPAAFVEDFEVDGDVTKAVWQMAKSVPPPCPARSTTARTSRPNRSTPARAGASAATSGRIW